MTGFWRLVALAAAIAGGARGSDPVHLLLIPESPVDAGVLASFEQETERLFGPVGIEVNLALMPEVVHTAGPGQAISLYWSGDCSDFRETAPSRAAAVLAFVEAEGALIRPVVRVYCDRVAGLLSASSEELGPHDARALFGRALARVAAHEVYHYLTQTPEHRHSALFSRVINRETLTRSGVGFDAQERHLLRQALVIRPWVL